MGPVEALGFVVPLIYSFYIILSTLRLDFWLSTFTASWPPPSVWHGDVFIARASCGSAAGSLLSFRAQRRHSDLRHLAGASGVSCWAGNSRPAFWRRPARDRSPICSASTSRRRWVERLMAEGAATDAKSAGSRSLFVDFRSFTAGASTRSPREVVDRLDGAFAVLVDILDRHGGNREQVFSATDYLALFGAPFEAHDAAHRRSPLPAKCSTANDQRQQGDERPLRIGNRRPHSARWSRAISARRGERNIR